MLKLFKGTGPGVILMIITAGLGLWGNAFFAAEKGLMACHGELMVFYRWLANFTGIDNFTGVIIAFSLVLITVSLIIAFNTSVLFISERTFLPGLLFVLVTSLVPGYQYLNPVIPAGILLHLAVIRMVGSYRKNGTAFCFFDSALMISAGSLFYANLIWYGVILFIGMVILRTPNIREAAISVIGLATPYAIIFGIFYVAGSDLSGITSGILESLIGRGVDIMLPRIVIVSLIFVALSLLTATIHLGSVFSTMKVKARKIFLLEIWVAVITILVYLFSPSGSGELIFIIAIPASYILANFYLSRKGNKVIPETMFIITILLAITVHILSV